MLVYATTITNICNFDFLLYICMQQLVVSFLLRKFGPLLSNSRNWISLNEKIRDPACQAKHVLINDLNIVEPSNTTIYTDKPKNPSTPETTTTATDGVQATSEGSAPSIGIFNCIICFRRGFTLNFIKADTKSYHISYI